MAATTAHPARPDTRTDPAGWRKAIGRRLRTARRAAGLRLVDVARLARVSPQYLSEVERGRKEASSEVLTAVTGALGMSLVELAGGVAQELAHATGGVTAPGGPSRRPMASARVTVLTSVPASGPGKRRATWTPDGGGTGPVLRGTPAVVLRAA